LFFPAHQTATALIAPKLRRSALLFVGLFALLINLDFEQNKQIQRGVIGQADAVSVADLALLLPQQSGWQALLALDNTGSADSSKKSLLGYPPGEFSYTFARLIGNRFPVSAVVLHYTSTRFHFYSPRSPPSL
jgi:hypothetical protein